MLNPSASAYPTAPFDTALGHAICTRFACYSHVIGTTLPHAARATQEHELPQLPAGELAFSPICASNEDNAFRRIATQAEHEIARFATTVDEDEVALPAYATVGVAAAARFSQRQRGGWYGRGRRRRQRRRGGLSADALEQRASTRELAALSALIIEKRLLHSLVLRLHADLHAYYSRSPPCCSHRRALQATPQLPPGLHRRSRSQP